MGSLTGMLYQGLVPVFADLDPATLNMDPASARRCITPRTKAILVVHHSGLAADMDAFLDLGREFNLPVVEDCAQAYGTTYKGRLAGTMGCISAFSLNHFKHINCGSGGMVITDDDRLRYLASLFLDKCYQREEKIRNPFFLAPNYQMTELQGRRGPGPTRARAGHHGPPQPARHAPQRTAAGYPRYRPSDGPGRLAATATSSTCLSSTSRVLVAPHASLRLPWRQRGCRTTPISSPAAGRCTCTTSSKSASAFPGSTFPFGAREYRAGDCPIAEDAFTRWITMNIYEHYTDRDIEEIAFGVGKVARYFAGRQPASARPAAERAA